MRRHNCHASAGQARDANVDERGERAKVAAAQRDERAGRRVERLHCRHKRLGIRVDLGADAHDAADLDAHIVALASARLHVAGEGGGAGDGGAGAQLVGDADLLDVGGAGRAKVGADDGDRSARGEAAHGAVDLGALEADEAVAGGAGGDALDGDEQVLGLADGGRLDGEHDLLVRHRDGRQRKAQDLHLAAHDDRLDVARQGAEVLPRHGDPPAEKRHGRHAGDDGAQVAVGVRHRLPLDVERERQVGDGPLPRVLGRKALDLQVAHRHVAAGGGKHANLHRHRRRRASVPLDRQKVTEVEIRERRAEVGAGEGDDGAAEEADPVDRGDGGRLEAELALAAAAVAGAQRVVGRAVRVLPQDLEKHVVLLARARVVQQALDLGVEHGDNGGLARQAQAAADLHVARGAAGQGAVRVVKVPDLAKVGAGDGEPVALDGGQVDGGVAGGDDGAGVVPAKRPRGGGRDRDDGGAVVMQEADARLRNHLCDRHDGLQVVAHPGRHLAHDLCVRHRHLRRVAGHLEV
mmetsp:Transcript_2101/g.5512  ORF Transcript_2101/g.5512 Transcript_2101/m.5512 type:complete len:522 (-) Transcript_2101:277-1842(-)